MTDTKKILLDWWTQSLDRETSHGRALSARLRRASDGAVLCEPKVHDLCHDLDVALGYRLDAQKLTRIAVLLAHVRTHTDKSLPHILGSNDPEKDPPKLSHLRFQRLIHAENADLTTGLRRAIQIAEYTCNVSVLGTDLLFWSEKTRRNWCFAYFRRSYSSQSHPQTQIQKEIAQ